MLKTPVYFMLLTFKLGQMCILILHFQLVQCPFYSMNHTWLVFLREKKKVHKTILID